MRVERVQGGFLVMVILIACGASAAYCGESSAEIKMKELKAALLEGMEQRDVEAVLSKYNLEYSFIDAERLDGEQELPIPPSELSGRYVGIIRNVSRDALFFESVSVQADIDRFGRLVRSEVKIVRTGL